MYLGKKIVVVTPAYNAARTVRQTYEEVQAQGMGEGGTLPSGPVAVLENGL